ncbi:MAG: histidine phosphatase family protein [Proteobacteria bacterium]|nr:histidine phosphatase family protein [Pseudomonadota bacterium]
MIRRVIFIRHGETTGDVEGRFGGTYDDALSVTGERQVAALVEELAGAGIGRVLSSPLQRARQTAEALAQRVGCPVEVRENLRERNQYGALSGMVKAEAAARFPAEVAALKDRLFTMPGAESYGDFVTRVREEIQRVIDGKDDCVAVVWHGGGMRVLFREILQLGELREVGDCAWVEVVISGAAKDVGKMLRMERE